MQIGIPGGSRKLGVVICSGRPLTRYTPSTRSSDTIIETVTSCEAILVLEGQRSGGWQLLARGLMLIFLVCSRLLTTILVGSGSAHGSGASYSFGRVSQFISQDT